MNETRRLFSWWLWVVTTVQLASETRFSWLKMSPLMKVTGLAPRTAFAEFSQDENRVGKIPRNPQTIEEYVLRSSVGQEKR